MKKTLKDKFSDKLVDAFLKGKIISALPVKFTKKLAEADKFRNLENYVRVKLKNQ